MSEEPGPCFGFKKKTVVMTCIGSLISKVTKKRKYDPI